MCFTDLAISDATQYGIQLIALELCDVHVTQEIARKSPELLSSLTNSLWSEVLTGPARPITAPRRAIFRR